MYRGSGLRGFALRASGCGDSLFLLGGLEIDLAGTWGVGDWGIGRVSGCREVAVDGLRWCFRMCFV